jgi:hypothetical protein
MSYYTDKTRFMRLIEDKIKEMKTGDTLRKEWTRYKGLTLYGYSTKTVDNMMKTIAETGILELTPEGDLRKNE